ncbi:DUF485 domain-containing protein [Microcella alkaliphila]|uniref:DUF485 domain-containing protein n=1 Tax=Microcella alkaliphila TaxID=279828 RepID=A0A0U5BL67_9MICO|nr:DUF485 domain-containing protein [Microcella alkaliphila]BAU30934.1 uncharacterized protein MalAC0309_0055 [Microcella alkaliphila]
MSIQAPVDETAHDVGHADVEPDMEALRAVQRSPRFRALKRRHRLFVLPATGLCLAWYLAYVLTAGYAPEVFAIAVSGSLNLGMVWGLAQVATTFAVTMLYVWYANKHLDPAAAEIRAELEPALAAGGAAEVAR